MKSKIRFVYIAHQIEEWNSFKLVGTYCLQLTAIDNWNREVKSNKFNVIINPSVPSAQTNTIEPIYIYKNHYGEMVLPEFLFFSYEGYISTIKSSNWIDRNDIKVITRVTEDINKNSFSLFVKVYGETGWQISISSRNSFCQISEIVVNITVLTWASKDCFEWSGPYESDWIVCNQGFILTKDNMWALDISYLPQINVKLYWIWGLFAMIVTWIYLILSIRVYGETLIHYWIWGLFAMIVTWIYLILSIRYGKVMLEPVIHIQSLMIMILSNKWVSTNWRVYLSWVQVFKFDLGFFNLILFGNKIKCTQSSERFSNAELYWEEAILNYMYMLIILGVFMIIIKVMKSLKWADFKVIIERLKIQNETIFWIIWCIILPFYIINVAYDISTMNSHIFSINALFIYSYYRCNLFDYKQIFIFEASIYSKDRSV